VQQGKRERFFSSCSFFINSLMPRALPTPEAPRTLMMRDWGSCALQPRLLASQPGTMAGV